MQRAFKPSNPCVQGAYTRRDAASGLAYVLIPAYREPTGSLSFPRLLFCSNPCVQGAYVPVHQKVQIGTYPSLRTGSLLKKDNDKYVISVPIPAYRSLLYRLTH